MKELTIFNYEEKQVRTIEINGEPWFVLRDICKVLELTTPARVAERLDKDEVSQAHIIDKLGRKQKTTIVDESGLYKVILRSDKPQAEPFTKWVTKEVLPSIRKTGMYMAPDKIEELLLNPDTIIQLALALKAEQTKNSGLKAQVAALENEIGESKQFTQFVFDLIKRVIEKAEKIENKPVSIEKMKITQRR